MPKPILNQTWSLPLSIDGGAGQEGYDYIPSNHYSFESGDPLFQKKGTHFSNLDSAYAWADRKYYPETVKDGNERGVVFVNDPEGIRHTSLLTGNNDAISLNSKEVEFPRDTLAAKWHSHPLFNEDIHGMPGFSNADIYSARQDAVPIGLSDEFRLQEYTPGILNDNLRFYSTEMEPVLARLREMQKNPDYTNTEEFIELQNKFREIASKYNITNEIFQQIEDPSITGNPGPKHRTIYRK